MNTALPKQANQSKQREARPRRQTSDAMARAVAATDSASSTVAPAVNPATLAYLKGISQRVETLNGYCPSSSASAPTATPSARRAPAPPTVRYTPLPLLCASDAVFIQQMAPMLLSADAAERDVMSSSASPSVVGGGASATPSAPPAPSSREWARLSPMEQLLYASASSSSSATPPPTPQQQQQQQSGKKGAASSSCVSSVSSSAAAAATAAAVARLVAPSQWPSLRDSAAAALLARDVLRAGQDAAVRQQSSTARTTPVGAQKEGCGGSSSSGVVEAPSTAADAPKTVFSAAPLLPLFSPSSSMGANRKSASTPAAQLMAALETTDHSLCYSPARPMLNSSNACFLNATLQAMAHCPPIASYLVSVGSGGRPPFTSPLQVVGGGVGGAKSTAPTTNPLSVLFSLAAPGQQQKSAPLPPLLTTALAQWVAQYHGSAGTAGVPMDIAPSSTAAAAATDDEAAGGKKTPSSSTTKRSSPAATTSTCGSARHYSASIASPAAAAGGGTAASGAAQQQQHGPTKAPMLQGLLKTEAFGGGGGGSTASPSSSSSSSPFYRSAASFDLTGSTQEDASEFLQLLFETIKVEERLVREQHRQQQPTQQSAATSNGGGGGPRGLNGPQLLFQYFGPSPTSTSHSAAPKGKKKVGDAADDGDGGVFKGSGGGGGGGGKWVTIGAGGGANRKKQTVGGGGDDRLVMASGSSAVSDVAGHSFVSPANALTVLGGGGGGSSSGGSPAVQFPPSPWSFFSSFIANGSLRSHVRKIPSSSISGSNVGSAATTTSVTSQPFFFLPVSVLSDGGAIVSIEEALKKSFTPEIVDVGGEGAASASYQLVKKEFIGVLPNVLVIQLKRWATTREGDVVKMDNIVTFGPTLAVPSEICAPLAEVHKNGEANGGGGGGGGSGAAVPLSERTYTLSSVVCHRGNEAVRGHYVTYLNNCCGAEVTAAAASPLPPPSALSSRGAASASASSLLTPLPVSQKIERYPMTLCDDHRLSVKTLGAAMRDTPYFLFYVRNY